MPHKTKRVSKSHKANGNSRRSKPMMAKRMMRRAYSSSVNELKTHPYISLGTLTLGAGLMTALILYKRNH